MTSYTFRRRWLSVVGIAAGCATALSCSNPAPAPAAAPSPRAPAEAPHAGSSPQSVSAPGNAQQDATAEATVARALELVSRLRELEATGPVKGRVIGRDEMV